MFGILFADISRVRSDRANPLSYIDKHLAMLDIMMFSNVYKCLKYHFRLLNKYFLQVSGIDFCKYTFLSKVYTLDRYFLWTTVHKPFIMTLKQRPISYSKDTSLIKWFSIIFCERWYFDGIIFSLIIGLRIWPFHLSSTQLLTAVMRRKISPPKKQNNIQIIYMVHNNSISDVF